MSNLVIVAIPDENDRVWKVSSEKVPHLTLLYLGDVDQVDNVDQIVRFVEHAASQTLRRFYLPVDRRGELGDDKADVLFFKRNRWDFKAVRDFRVQLLKDNNIRTAYDSAKQHPGPWNPHLTLGYPNNPAKPDDSDRDFGFFDVAFNKIAVWTDEYDGPEFLIKEWYEDWETLESDPTAAVPVSGSSAGWSDQGAEFLEHYGVKGMRWGVRKDRDASGAVADVQGSAARGALRSRGSIKKATGSRYMSRRTEVRLALFGPAATLDKQVRAELKGLDREVKLGKADKKWEKDLANGKAWVEINNKSADHFNKNIEALNNKYPKDRDWSNEDYSAPKSPDFKRYMKDINKLTQDSMNSALKDLDLKSPSGKKEVEVESGGLPGDFRLKVKQVRHADDDDVIEFSVKFQFDSTGRVTGFSLDDDAVGELAQSAEDGAEFMVHTGIMDPDHFLEHYGVKGMRWGVRREKLGSSAKKVGKAAGKAVTFVRDANFETNTAKGTNANSRLRQEIHGMAKDAFKRTDLPELKNKPEYKDAKKLRNRLLNPRDPHTKAYRKEARELYIKRLEEAANSKTNASGTRQYTIRERGWELPAKGGALPRSKYFWDVTSRDIEHADGDLDMTIELIMDEDGYITDMKESSADDSMAQSMELGAGYLISLGLDVGMEHYGVKGMRWGVRKDRGTPTAVTPTATSRVRGGDKRKTKIDTAGGQNHDASPDALKVAEATAKLRKSGVVALSNQELREVAQRKQLEMQVKQLTANQGQRFINNLLGNTLPQEGQNLARGAVREGGKGAVKVAAKKVIKK